MDIKVGRNWGLFAAGIALVIIGFVLLMVPGLTLVSIAVIAGCMFLAAGIVDAYAYFKFCGIAFFLWPGTFALFLGFFLMARGVQMAVYGVSLPQATIVAHTH